MDFQYIDAEKLLKPISKKFPSGEDLSFSYEFDEIKEARRSDDPNLSQGDWVTEIKESDWKAVKNSCLEILSSSSKDLQLLAWLTESLGREHGLSGIKEGFAISGQIIEAFWDSLFPLIENEDDLEEREVRIEWMVNSVHETINTIPLASDKNFNLITWLDSKDVDNQIRSKPDIKKQLLEEGKIDGQAFTEAVMATPINYYQELKKDIPSLKNSIKSFDNILEEKFGKHKPSLKSAHDTLNEFEKTLIKIFEVRGIPIHTAPTASSSNENPSVESVGVVDTQVMQQEFVSSVTKQAKIIDRQSALYQLHEIANFFRATEPHSPVAFLLDRAVRWGGMNLNEWLEETIKDKSVLENLKDALGVTEEQLKKSAEVAPPPVQTVSQAMPQAPTPPKSDPQPKESNKQGVNDAPSESEKKSENESSPKNNSSDDFFNF